ncbi:MAG TPA: peptidase MA family metallohydrolase [Polyangiaceae bacterium]|nr:peptidase MA family metallohydrolase [Polyangiaceae bacterium]
MFAPRRRPVLRRLAFAWLLLFAWFGVGGIARAADPIDAPREIRYGLPSDQPKSAARKLELPQAPPSFTTVDAGWIHFSYPPSARTRVEQLIASADSIRDELASRLGHAVLGNVHVRIARTAGEMSTLAPEGAPYPKYASGVAYSEIGLVLLTLSPTVESSLFDVNEVFRHELAHVALEDATGGSDRVPHWFNEGLAVHLSGESSLVRLRTLSTATLAGRLVPLGRLERGFPSDATAAELAYAESADVVRFLLRQQDRERFPALISRIREGQSFASALRDSYGLDLPSLEYEWREEIGKRYSFWPVLFSGSLVWAGVLLLFVLGFRRRRQKSRETLERWAREEASAELRRARASLASSAPPARVHIVLPGHETPPPLPSELPGMPAAPPEGDVPRVEHDGQWHTLH